MKWAKWDGYSIKANGYSICKVIVNGKEVYELWQLPATLIERFNDPNDAKVQAVALNRAKQALSVSKDRGAGQDDKMAGDYRRSGG